MRCEVINRVSNGLRILPSWTFGPTSNPIKHSDDCSTRQWATQALSKSSQQCTWSVTPAGTGTKKSDRPPLVWKGSVCNVRSVARRATFSFFWARLQLPCMVPGHWCLLPACVVWYLFQSCLLALKFDSGQIRVRKSKPTRWFMGVELVLPSCERAFWSSPCSKCMFEMRWQSFHFVQCFAQEHSAQAACHFCPWRRLSRYKQANKHTCNIRLPFYQQESAGPPDSFPHL